MNHPHPGGSRNRLHRSRHFVRELHSPITILSTLRQRASARFSVSSVARNQRHRADRIILLIGIVKKNAIYMIDFALEAERKEGKAPLDASTKHACCVSGHHDDHHGGSAGRPAAGVGAGVGSELRRPWASTIVGGLISASC